MDTTQKAAIKYEIDTVLTPPEKPTAVRNEVVNELGKKRYEFNLALMERGYYPNVPYPGDVWIFEEVLGIDPNKIPVQTITKTTYKVFAWDFMGHKKIVDENGRAKVVTRKFDSEQRKALKEWWPLLSERMRGEPDEWIVTQRTDPS